MRFSDSGGVGTPPAHILKQVIEEHEKRLDEYLRLRKQYESDRLPDEISCYNQCGKLYRREPPGQELTPNEYAMVRRREALLSLQAPLHKPYERPDACDELHAKLNAWRGRLRDLVNRFHDFPLQSVFNALTHDNLPLCAWPDLQADQFIAAFRRQIASLEWVLNNQATSVLARAPTVEPRPIEAAFMCALPEVQREQLGKLVSPVGNKARAITRDSLALSIRVDAKTLRKAMAGEPVSKPKRDAITKFLEMRQSQPKLGSAP